VTTSLLDVNVLLALLDSDHVHHRFARHRLEREIPAGWASCAITQNGLVRVMSQPRYPSPVSPRVAIERLSEACANRHHEYWQCSISVLDESYFDFDRIHGPRQVTDAYLLALAVERQGRFVTFDRAVSLTAVRGATESHLLVI